MKRTWPIIVLAALLAVLPSFGGDVIYRTFPFAFQSAATADGPGVANDVGALGTVVFVVTGSFSATVNFEATADDSRWDPIEVTSISTGASSTTATSPGTYWAPVPALSQVRARISNYASGTLTVTGRGAQARLVIPKGGSSFPPTSDLDMGSFALTNCADPTSAQDVATKAYVDAHAGSDFFSVRMQIENYVVATLDLSSPQFQTFTSGSMIGFLWGRKTNDGSYHEDGTYTVPAGKTFQLCAVCGTTTQSVGTTVWNSKLDLNGGAFLGPENFRLGFIMENTGSTSQTIPQDLILAGGVLSFQTMSSNSPIYAYAIARVY
jgi:hypothetical protein